MPRIKRKNINLKKYIYLHYNSEGYFERTSDKTLIDYLDNIYKINIKYQSLWEKFRVEQYRTKANTKPTYEFYERGSFEDYQGYWVKVNNFILDYVEGYEYTFKKVKES